MRILLIEDDTVLGAAVRDQIAADGQSVDWVTRLDAAGDAVRATSYDLILLDLMLPDGRGIGFLKGLRARGDVTPVIILTALDQVSDRIEGLNAGADDYLVKPFDLAELSARIGSVARRYSGNPNPIVTHGPLEIDLAARSIYRDGKPVQLTAREWALFEAFLARPGQLLSKAQLEEKLYAFDAEVESNTIEVHVSRLRKKLGARSSRPSAAWATGWASHEVARQPSGAARPVARPRADGAVAAGGDGDGRDRPGRDGRGLRQRPARDCGTHPAAGGDRHRRARRSGVTQRLAPIREHDEFFTYLVRDAEGRILLQSHAADPAVFPPWDGPGFRQTATHRLYSDAALQGTIRITVAEPLAHRASVAREIQMGLGLPLLIVLPVALAAIILAVRFSLDPLRRFRARLEARGARDLSEVPASDLPTEIGPLAETLNSLLARLREAFEAERSFAANAAHELRTPLAGAIAQAQRLRSETRDPATEARAAEIEATLKRLTRLSERLMQLARAEGGRLRMDRSADLRAVARVVVDDIGRAGAPGRIALTLPDTAVMSDLDPDAFAILCRNLVENALRHGAETAAVEVTLTADGN
jgi:DNA-binding response OmpR family regulator/signal transduction histidine kinase